MVNVHANALRTLYTDVCDVWVSTDTFDSVSKRRTSVWAKTIESQPCRLSFDSSPSATVGNVAEISQDITLILSSTVTINAGSRIDVKRDGKTVSYVASGEPKRYNLTEHQEIKLKLKDGEA